MVLAFVTHPVFELHLTGRDHPEKLERTQVINHAVKAYDFSATLKTYEAPMVTREAMVAVHTPSYIDWLTSIAPKTETIFIDEDTVMSPHTLHAAFHAAGAVVSAVDLVMSQQAQAVFCNVRPPGHHAEREKAMGFCFLNNVAIGAKYALDHYRLKRIAIIDFDVHHGNGTQEIFQNEKRVLLCSSFEHPLYPGYDAELDNAHILNVPLPAGTNGLQYREYVEDAWFDQLAAFKPELIFFSAGFDAHRDDPLADINLKKEDYVWLTEKIAKIAAVYAHGRMISVLEGGYNLNALAECVPAHMNAMVIST